MSQYKYLAETDLASTFQRHRREIPADIILPLKAWSQTVPPISVLYESGDNDHEAYISNGSLAQGIAWQDDDDPVTMIYNWDKLELWLNHVRFESSASAYDDNTEIALPKQCFSYIMYDDVDISEYLDEDPDHIVVLQQMTSGFSRALCTSLSSFNSLPVFFICNAEGELDNLKDKKLHEMTLSTGQKIFLETDNVLYVQSSRYRIFTAEHTGKKHPFTVSADVYDLSVEHVGGGANTCQSHTAKDVSILRARTKATVRRILNENEHVRQNL